MAVAGLIFDGEKKIMESIIKNVWEVAIVNNEIECADRIVYETGTHEAVAASGRAGGCFISLNEVSRLP